MCKGAGGLYCMLVLFELCVTLYISFTLIFKVSLTIIRDEEDGAIGGATGGGPPGGGTPSGVNGKKDYGGDRSSGIDACILFAMWNLASSCILDMVIFPVVSICY